MDKKPINIRDFVIKKNSKNTEYVKFKKFNGMYMPTNRTEKENFLIVLAKQTMEKFKKENYMYKQGFVYKNYNERFKIEGFKGSFKTFIEEILKEFPIFDVADNKEKKVNLTDLLTTAIDFEKDFFKRLALHELKPMIMFNEKLFVNKDDMLNELSQTFIDYDRKLNQINKSWLYKFINDNQLHDFYNVDEYDMELQYSEEPIEDFSKYFNINKWLDTFKEKEPKQYSFFIRLFIDHVFNLASFDFKHPFNIVSRERKIRVALGSNRSGKGTLASILSLIPNCTEIVQGSIQEAIAEYKKQEIFKADTSLVVDGEFKLDLKTDSSIINAFKKSTRVGETNTTREIGKNAEQVEFKGSHFICVNPLVDNEQTALKDSYKYFGEWVAYDRFDIVYINWSNDKELWQKFNFIMNVIEKGDKNIKSLVGAAICYEVIKRIWQFDVAYDEYAETYSVSKLSEEFYEFQKIPDSAKTLNQFDHLNKVDKKLKNIMELFLQYEYKFKQTNDIVDNTERRVQQIKLYKQVQSKLIKTGYSQDEIQIKLYVTDFYFEDFQRFALSEEQMLMICGNNWNKEVAVMNKFIIKKKKNGINYVLFMLELYKQERGYE